MIFNKTDLHEFLEYFKAMNESLGITINHGIDAGIMLEVMFLTNSINNKSTLNNKLIPIVIEQE